MFGIIRKVRKCAELGEDLSITGHRHNMWSTLRFATAMGDIAAMRESTAISILAYVESAAVGASSV